MLGRTGGDVALRGDPAQGEQGGSVSVLVVLFVLVAVLGVLVVPILFVLTVDVQRITSTCIALRVVDKDMGKWPSQIV